MSVRCTCDACAVRDSALCKTLPPSVLLRVNRMSVRRRYKAGRIISATCLEDDGLSTIVSGVVKLVRALDDGRQQIVGLQFAGDLVGDPFGRGSEMSSEAATDVELCGLTRAQFTALLEENPLMQAQMVRQILSDLDAAREWMLLLGRKTAEERVASFFLLLAEREQQRLGAPDQHAPVRVELPISRTEIADFLGLTIETVSRQIRHFKDQGVLRLDSQRNILVPRLEDLRRPSGGRKP